MPKFGLKIVFRIFGSLALLFTTAFIVLTFYLADYRPADPFPSKDFVVRFKVFGVVYVTEEERNIASALFCASLGFFALAAIASKRLER